MRHHGCMKAYTEDLRRKVVEALEERGMGNRQAARTFGMSLSSVKRYVAKARRGDSLSPRKHPGPRPKPQTRRASQEVARGRCRATPGCLLERAGQISGAGSGG